MKRGKISFQKCIFSSISKIYFPRLKQDFVLFALTLGYISAVDFFLEDRDQMCLNQSAHFLKPV